MFPQENQPGNLVNVLQLGCPGGRQTLLLGGQIQFVYTQAARDTDRQPHTGRRPCRRLPQGARRPQEKDPSAGQPSPAQDKTAGPALPRGPSRWVKPPCLGVIGPLVPWKPVEAGNPLSVSSSADGFRESWVI